MNDATTRVLALLRAVHGSLVLTPRDVALCIGTSERSVSGAIGWLWQRGRIGRWCGPRGRGWVALTGESNGKVP